MGTSLVQLSAALFIDNSSGYPYGRVVVIISALASATVFLMFQVLYCDGGEQQMNLVTRRVVSEVDGEMLSSPVYRLREFHY